MAAPKKPAAPVVDEAPVAAVEPEPTLTIVVDADDPKVADAAGVAAEPDTAAPVAVPVEASSVPEAAPAAAPAAAPEEPTPAAEPSVDLGDIFDVIEIAVDQQTKLWGNQDFPDGTGIDDLDTEVARLSDERVRFGAEDGSLTFRDISSDSFKAALAQSDQKELVKALVKHIATTVLWVQKIVRENPDA